MIILRQKQFGLFSSKVGKIDREVFLKEFESYPGHNKQAIDGIKNLLKPGTKLPPSLEKYVSFIFEKYKSGIYKTDKDMKILGYDEIIKLLKKWNSSFGKDSCDKVFISEGKSSGFPKQTEYFMWWERARSLWMFVISWGGFSQGLFGLGEGDDDPMKKLQYVI